MDPQGHIVIACPKGLRDRLAAELGIEAQGEGVDWAEDIETLERLRPSEAAGVFVCSELMRQVAGRGPAAMERLRRAGPLVLVATTTDAETADLLPLVDAFALLDNDDRVTMEQRAALAGQGYSVLDSGRWQSLLREHDRVRRLRTLLPDEVALLDGLRRGLTNAEIADELGLAVSVVKTRVRALLQKLELRNRTEAAVLAARHDRLLRELRHP